MPSWDARRELLASERALQLRRTFTELPRQLAALQNVVLSTISATRSYLIIVALVLVLFIVHQLFFWVDRSPEVAFQRAADVVEAAEATWDTTGLIWNALSDVLNGGVIPIYNAGVFYVVEPLAILTLEVFSILFFGENWDGAMPEGEAEYAGLDCMASAEAQRWCGRYAYYARDLTGAEAGEGFADPEGAFARRLQRITLSVASARRLSELEGETTFLAPSFDVDVLVEALDAMTRILVVFGASISDLAFSVLWDVASTTAQLIADSLFALLGALFNVLKMAVKSGFLQDFLSIGVDFLLVAITKIAIPLLFALIDALFCVLDLFRASGHAEQLHCAEAQCFKGEDPAFDLLVFTSLPIITAHVSEIVQTSINSKTGRRFTGGQAFSFGAFGVEGGVSTFHVPESTKRCSACFNCKVSRGPRIPHAR